MRRPPLRAPEPRQTQPTTVPPGPPYAPRAIYLDPRPERTLLRLWHLVRDVPDPQPELHWDEAQRLSAGAGDAGRLLLVGFARRLPPPLNGATRDALFVAVGEVRDPAKRALAYLALADVAGLEAHELQVARALATELPDAALRIMILTQLARRAR